MITAEIIAKLFPHTAKKKRDRFIEPLNEYLPEFEINTAKRVRAFLATCGIESDYLRATREYADGWDYDKTKNPRKARELGNINIGDGPEFKGGGIIQNTGRSNYRALNKTIGRRLGIDFEKNPEAIERPDVAVLAACQYWKDNNLNAWADKGKFYEIQSLVNRGAVGKKPLHWEKRRDLYDAAAIVIPASFAFRASVAASPITLPLHKEERQNQAVNAVSVNASDSALQDAPIILTPTEPAKEEPAKNDSNFLASAVDKNVSPEELKTVARSAAPKILVRFARPFAVVYAMLEAGNIYAWLGVAVGVIGLGLLIYWHRRDLKKALDTVKNKFLQ